MSNFLEGFGYREMVGEQNSSSGFSTIITIEFILVLGWQSIYT
jgi:hypothetical protein